MDWKKLLCEKRQCNQSNKNNKKNNNDMRNEFQKDYVLLLKVLIFQLK